MEGNWFSSLCVVFDLVQKFEPFRLIVEMKTDALLLEETLEGKLREKKKS